MGTKNEPGKFDCYSKLEPDEPYFLLRGKDPIAWLLVKLWIQIRKLMHESKSLPPGYIAKLNEAEICAENMKIYASKHPSNIGNRAIEKAIGTYNNLFVK